MKCPYCGAEVTSEDLYCGECGKRLPAVPGESRRSRWPLIAAILGVLIVACIACGVIWILLPDGTDNVVSDVSPTPSATPVPSESYTALPSPTEQVSWSTYSSTELGLTLGYPNDWLVEEDASLGQVVFAPQREGLEVDEFLRTTSFAVVVDRAEELLVDTALQALEEVGGFLVDEYPDADLGEVEAASVAGQDGALMTIEGEFSQPGARLKGWLAATVAYDHVYIFVAGAQIEEWSQREATLQAMLDSAVLSQPSPEPTVPVVTPGSTSVPTSTGASPTPAPTATTPMQIEGPDPYEPDDNIAESALITTDGVPQAHNLHVEGDRDYLFFQATAGYAYTIQTLDLGAEIDTIIYLLDGDGQEIARNDDGTEEPLASLIIWIAPGSGTYYVMVRDLAEDSSGADASYSVSVTESASVEGADPYEPDDTFSEASLIDVDGASQAHTFHTTTDVDCVWFMADGGTEYVIETLNLSGHCDTEMYLYDEGGTELAYDDDSAAEDYASLIVWEAPADGIYYVAAVDFNGRAGPGVGYEIAVSLQ
jgi:hypothetical protein